MDESRATELLGDSVTEGGLYSLGWYLAWRKGDSEACLDGRFTADDLEAIAYWMRRA